MTDTKRYAFRWMLRGHLDEVCAVLCEPVDFSRWWPSAWLESVEAAVGDAHGVGRVVSMRTRGRSPEVLSWAARCTAAAPTSWTWQLFGDLEGALTLDAFGEGDHVTVTFTWEVSLEQPALRGSLFGARAFAADLAWMMARGEESLRDELMRRVSDDAIEPRGRVEPSTLHLTLAGVGLAAAVAGIVGILLRRRP